MTPGRRHTSTDIIDNLLPWTLAASLKTTKMPSDPLSAIATALQKEQIIPDVLPPSFTPSILFSIVYPNGSEVNLGNELTADATQDEPEITLAAMNAPWDDRDAPEASYTLAMLDPDAPYRKDAIYRSFRHWVVSTSS